MMRAGLDARAVALRILTEAQSRRIPTEPLLAPTLARSGLDARDRRLATTLVQTTHRWRGRADRILDHRLERGVRSLEARTLNILRLAYVQLFHLDQLPPHAVVHTAVDLARRAGGEGKARLVNRILRGLLAHPPGPEEWRAPRGSSVGAAIVLEGELSHPAWLLERWLARWGRSETERICEWNNRPPRFHLRVAGGAAAAAEVAARLGAEGIDAVPGRLLPEALRLCATLDLYGHPLLAEGRVSVQDESQMLVGRLWPPEATGPVLDLCAAPGTKSCHLAELEPETAVFAADAAPRRLERVRDAARRLRLGNVSCFVGDGLRPPLRPGLARVLVDAPCSALGVLQRRPDARWLRSPGEIHDAARRQALLLDAAADLLVPGGFLLYSLCTLESEESDEQVDAFLERHPGFEPAQLPAIVPEALRDRPGIVRVLPGTLEMEGLFAALLRRKA
ncbi:MAG: 16S rRNA (cytosine(967)-C(5))-methyltransferase RsmB [Candidatus Eisenbacteria bacterium]|uniref:16S rRNA (cytosine(967)-C(5))-methyltransferase n=1 Tax=Eiseniibacteriota bacterium TaxID=2212470 RepID=A0A937X8Z2_UNCEI|nr:16S rRNA (cytosine(967)-C(5))-methyltransferase RsmB [Candidatus Eisenbacteria bacterium]